MNAMKRPLLALSATLLLLAPAAAHAQWVTALDADNIVSNAASNQNTPLTVSDGAGGFVTVWRDTRTGGHNDLYAQSLDANGFPRWTANGVVVDSVVGALSAVGACSDDSGGVIVTWQRGNGAAANRVFAQRVDAFGQRRWGTGGLRAGTAEVTQTLPRICADGAGGAIVVWANWIAATTANVFGQRLAPDGTRLWSATGDSLVARGEVRSLTVTSRPGGGAFIGYWYSFGPLGMVAVDNARTRLMSDVITTDASQTSPPGLYSATAGDGAYLMMAGGNNMSVRWFGANGDRWPASQRVVAGTHTQSHPMIAGGGPDGSALLAWRDGRASGGGVFAQKLRVDGTPMWGTDGLFISNDVTLNGGGHTIAADDLNGAWVVWSANVARRDQHVRSDGSFWLAAAGDTFSTANSSNFTYDGATIVPGLQSTAIVVWATTQSPGTYNDMHAKRIFGDGSLTTTGVEDGFMPGAGVALAAGPSPARGDAVTLRFALTRAGHATLELFGLQGERVATIADEALSAGRHARTFDTSRLAPGVYHARLTTSEGVANARFVRVR